MGRHIGLPLQRQPPLNPVRKEGTKRWADTSVCPYKDRKAGGQKDGWVILGSGFADSLKEMQRFLKKLPVVLFFGLLAFPLSAFCQVDTAWVRYYNGPGDKEDEIVSFAVDDSGNAVVAGYSGNNPSWDLVTIKYDRNGNQLWRQSSTGIQRSQLEPNSLVLDKNGSTYVTGGRGDKGLTLKYDSNGFRLWEALFPDVSAFFRAVTTDVKGNVYVTGISGYYYTGFDYLTIKYDSNGNQKWAAIFNKGQNYSDRSLLIVPDNNGNVYVGGHSDNFVSWGEAEWITIKYDSLGNQLWMKQFSTWQGASRGAPIDMKLDAAGSVYLAGGNEDSSTSADYATVKYDSQGNLQWAARFDGSTNDWDFATAMALDSQNNVYVTGFSYAGAGTNNDIVTIKYDSEGNPLWERTYNGSANSRDEARDICLDSAGNAYVAGLSIGANSTFDYLILKYDSNGNLLWEKRYEKPVFFYGSELLSVQRNGDLYLAGTDTQNAHDFVTIKYSPLPALKGDLNLDGILTMADVVLMLNFTFNGDPFAAAPAAGDLSCDGKISPADAVIMLQIFFLSAPPPC